MHHALIISDHIALAQTIKTEFASAGWTNNSISVNAMIKHGSHNATANNSVVLVIDRELGRRYGSVTVEMSAIIANIARKTALYLVFEHECTQNFEAWLLYSTGTFEFAHEPHNLCAAIAAINRKHIEGVPASAYCSPTAAGF